MFAVYFIETSFATLSVPNKSEGGFFLIILHPKVFLSLGDKSIAAGNIYKACIQLDGFGLAGDRQFSHCFRDIAVLV